MSHYRLLTKLGIIFGILVLGGTSVQAQNRSSNNLWAETFAPFPAGNGIDGGLASVYTIAESFGSNLYIGGDFTQVGSDFTENIALYNTATESWQLLGNGVNGHVNSIVYANNRVFVGGSFTLATNPNATTVQVNNVAIWNLITNTWEPMGAAFPDNGTSGEVFAMEVNAAGNVIVGGDFINTRDASRTLTANNIAQYDPFGQQWSALGTGIGEAADIVYALERQGNTIIVGGDFDQVNGGPASNLAKWNGTQWQNAGAGSNGPIHSIFNAGGSTQIYIGGEFTQVNGVNANRIARLNIASNLPTPLGNASNNGIGGLNAVVKAITVSDDDILHVGGFFGTTSDADKNLAVSNLAHFSIPTNTWTSFGSGTNTTQSNDAVRAIYVNGVSNDYDLFIGGSISTAGNKGANGLGLMHSFDQVEDSNWEIPGTSTCDGEMGTSVKDLEYDLGSTLFAALEEQGQNNPHTVKFFDTLTNTWNGLGERLECIACGFVAPLVNDIEIDNNRGFIYAGGVFDQINPSSSPTMTGPLAYFDLNTGQWNEIASLAASGIAEIKDIAISPVDGKVYFAGNFSSASNSTSGTVNSSFIIGWNPDTDELINIGGGVNALVNSITVTTNNHIIASGNFVLSNSGVSMLFVGRYNLTSELWAPMGGLFGIEELTIHPQTGEIYAARPFTEASFGDTKGNGLMKWDDNLGDWARVVNKAGNGLIDPDDQLNINDLTFNNFGQVYVAGRFGNAFEAGGFVNVKNNGIWDTQTDQWKTLGGGRSTLNTDGLQAIAVAPNGEIAVAGQIIEDVNGDNCAVQVWRKIVAAPFPLLSFDGYLDNLFTRLHWDVSAGSDYDYYVIEKSIDAVTFMPIANVNSELNVAQYAYTDSTPFHGRSYYRLKLYDHSGEFTTSDLVEVYFDLGIKGAYQLYPNPATDEINLMAGMPEKTLANFQIMDMQGRVIRQETNNIPQGLQYYQFDISDLKPGLYMMLVRQEGELPIFSQKFIKQ